MIASTFIFLRKFVANRWMPSSLIVTRQHFQPQVSKPHLNFKSKTKSKINKRWNLFEQVRANA